VSGRAQCMRGGRPVGLFLLEVFGFNALGEKAVG
jgi:hypothetical protein